MAIQTYDPASIICSFNGATITGFAEGTFVLAERNADAYTKYVGSGGEVARSRSRDRSGMVTFTLMCTSQANDLLDAFAADDELGNTGAGPLQIKDALGTTLISAGRAWIRKRPNVEFSNEVTTREWIIDCAEMSWVNGGTPGV